MKKKSMSEEYLEIVSSILENPEFQRRKEYPHHGDISVYDHCLAVSYTAYCVAKKMGVDYRSAAIGGLLHDFYTSPWQDCTEKRNYLKNMDFLMKKKQQRMLGNIFLSIWMRKKKILF